jgi:hypothetical protein
MTRSRMTPGSSARGLDVRGARPPDPLPPTPQCLFPSNGKPLDADITCEELQQALTTMAGTVVTPVDALVLFHHYTDHFPNDYEIDRVTATALLKLSGASETEIRTFLSGLAGSPRDHDAQAADTTLVSTGADSSGLLTPKTPSPAGRTPGGLGAMGATAPDRDTECLCVPSPTSSGVTGPMVPTTSMTDHPVDRVRERKVVTIGMTPESSSMLQDPSLGLCSAQTSGSSVTLISAIAAASALGDAELECVKPRLGPSPTAELREPRSSGPPLSLYQQPNTEATPLAPTTDGPTSVGAGNSIDGGRPRARRLDIDREAQAEENEEDEEEVEATKEEDSPAPSEDLGTPRSTGTGARQTGRVKPRARLASRPPPTRTHSRPTRRTPRKLRTPHKDDATEADTPNGTPTTTRTDE